MFDEQKLTWEERAAAVDFWRQQGLSKRHANVLAYSGYASMEDLHTVTDWDLQVMPNLGKEGRAAILDLLGRQRPANLKTAAETRAQFEQVWRTRLGEERFGRLMDEISAMAGEDLDRANHPAAQALWDLARKRRSTPPAS
jgi:hypothetical protein